MPLLWRTYPADFVVVIIDSLILVEHTIALPGIEAIHKHFPSTCN